MKKISAIIASFALLGSVATGCTNAEKGATTGALGGAAVGALVSRNSVKGAAIGAVVGGAAGYLLGKTADGRCRYSDGSGGTYIAAC